MADKFYNPFEDGNLRVREPPGVRMMAGCMFVPGVGHIKSEYQGRVSSMFGGKAVDVLEQILSHFTELEREILTFMSMRSKNLGLAIICNAALRQLVVKYTAIDIREGKPRAKELAAQYAAWKADPDAPKTMRQCFDQREAELLQVRLNMTPEQVIEAEEDRVAFYRGELERVNKILADCESRITLWNGSADPSNPQAYSEAARLCDTKMKACGPNGADSPARNMTLEELSVHRGNCIYALSDIEGQIRARQRSIDSIKSNNGMDFDQLVKGEHYPNDRQPC